MALLKGIKKYIIHLCITIKWLHIVHRVKFQILWYKVAYGDNPSLPPKPHHPLLPWIYSYVTLHISLCCTCYQCQNVLTRQYHYCVIAQSFHSTMRLLEDKYDTWFTFVSLSHTLTRNRHSKCLFSEQMAFSKVNVLFISHSWSRAKIFLEGRNDIKITL